MRSPRPPSHNGGLLLRGATEGREGRREKRREDRECPPSKKIKMRSWSPLARRNQLVQINIFMLLVPASACKAWVLLSKPTLLQWDPGHWRRLPIPLELGVVEWSGNRNGAGRKSSERERERSGERGKLCER